MKFSVFVLIPVLNEEFQIRKVITQLRVLEDLKILVVDDNSMDKTVKILEELKVDYISNKFSAGRDGSIKTGLMYYKEFRSEDWIVIFDGDGQHSISFIELIQSQPPNNTVFKGNRFSYRSIQINTPPDRLLLANKLREFLAAHIEINIEDLNCGLIGVPNILVSWALNNCKFDKHFSVEICIRLSLEKSKELHLLEVPISAIYRTESPKHFHLYKKLPSKYRFEIRYNSIIDKILSIVDSQN